MKKVLIGIILGLIFITGCSRNDNSLILVTEAGFAPYEYYENGKIVGVDIDIANEIANYMGKELVVKDIAFDSIINELNSGKADFAAAGMSITPERLEEVDFSIQYITSNQVVMVRKDSNITMDTIDGKKIAVQLGNVADSYAEKNYKNSEIIRQKKYLTMVEDLKAGKVDLIIMDNLPAQEIVKNNDGLKLLPGYLFSDSYGIAVKKGNDKLLNNINTVLEKLQSEGKIEEYIINHSK